MARQISQSQKDSAQWSADFAVPASLWSGFIGVATSGAAALALPVAGFGVAVWYAAWSAGFAHYAHRMNRVVRDPPDSRFDVPAQLGRIPFILEELSAREPFGELSVLALSELLEADRYAAAMVRAIERSQGAAIANAPDAESERFAEAEKYAQELGQHLRRFADSSRPVAEAALRLPELDWSQVSGGRLLDLLPPQVLSELYLAGVSLEVVP